MSNEKDLRNRVRQSLTDSTSRNNQPGSPSAGWIEFATDRLIADLRLTVAHTAQQHRGGSALELGETQDEYNERVRMKTIHRITGSWED